MDSRTGLGLPPRPQPSLRPSANTPTHPRCAHSPASGGGPGENQRKGPLGPWHGWSEKTRGLQTGSYGHASCANAGVPVGVGAQRCAGQDGAPRVRELMRDNFPDAGSRRHHAGREVPQEPAFPHPIPGRFHNLI